VTDPTDLLVAPPEPDASISQGYANPLDLINLASPSAWINDLIAALTGVDVFEWCCDWVGGDWSALATFAGALRQLDASGIQLAINVQIAADTAGHSWHGHAADQAGNYFTQLATAISAQHDALARAADDYDRAARGAWMLASQLGNVLQALADRAIIAGISAAAGTITAESGVGAAVGYAVTALVLLDMLRLINSAATKIQLVGGATLAIAGALMDNAFQGGDLDMIALPGRPYETPVT
jgi:hypothetical protein